MKKYHSMAARGEQVDLSELAENEQAEKHTESLKHVQKPAAINSTTNAAAEQPQASPGAESAQNPTLTAPSTSTTKGAPAPTLSAPVAGSVMPQALLNTGHSYYNSPLSRNDWLTTNLVQDEGLKNLMMSWYYAGYYTGLLEGQQKAFASMQQGG